jgi:thiosulfate dehydrogenase [quinone] large subunit
MESEGMLMTDIFGFLRVDQWIALLRIAVGLWWIKSVFHKPLRQFVGGGMVKWTLSLADNHPVPAIGGMMRRLVEPNASWFPYLILFGEAAVGLGLTFGFLTPVSALVGIFLNLNYLLLAGVRPRDRSVNPAYQCEQGQNLMMIASQVVLFFLAAGATWGVDGLLGLF